jgi:transcription elongation factor Elf1
MEQEERSEDMEKEAVEALCRECGQGFKVFVDRLIGKDDQKSSLGESFTCPVCGGNECNVVHKGSS